MSEREAIDKMTAMLERVREYLRENTLLSCDEDCCGCGGESEKDEVISDINSLLSRVPGPRL